MVREVGMARIVAPTIFQKPGFLRKSGLLSVNNTTGAKSPNFWLLWALLFSQVSLNTECVFLKK
ncbi:MAG: hypothetical protein CMJ78_20455 [Planctomycetaceae bacterium]|nr:hypothetical protein [Planctomycetaceae bacterium]